MLYYKNNQSGAMLIISLVAITLFIALASGLISLGLIRHKLYLQEVAKEQSLDVAEAGINYYRWHLAHDQTDYADGTADSCIYPNACGPYEHPFDSPSGSITGKYSLEITPPPVGSTIVDIKSTAWIDEYPNIKRVIEVRYGIPSLAHYSFLTNSDVWFGDNEHVNGEFHSNGGVRMDGTNDSVVTSLKDTYICGTSHGCDSGNCNAPCNWIAGTGCECPGVWGSGPDSSLWQFPVPIVDFSNITADIAQIKTDAQASGVYFGSSGGGNDGYHVVFKSDKTFDVYIINSLKPALKQLNDNFSDWVYVQEEINTETFSSNYSIPANGLIYFEDDVWVDGTVNGRATLVAARLPDNPNKRKNILINNNISYLIRDGSSILGLIAQNNVKVPRYAPNDLVIDAILLAQNGRVFRNLYSNYRVTNSIEIYGSIITNKIWTWTWANFGGTLIDGYKNTYSIYDPQVTFSPPPSFPTTNEYAFISWAEE